MNRGTGGYAKYQTFENLQIGDTFLDIEDGEVIWNGTHWQSNNHKFLQDPHHGDLVYYIPFEGCNESRFENGRIKLIRDSEYAFVVYHCNHDWYDFEQYIGALTPIEKLRQGWINIKTQ